MAPFAFALNASASNTMDDFPDTPTKRVVIPDAMLDAVYPEIRCRPPVDDTCTDDDAKPFTDPSLRATTKLPAIED